MNSLKASNPLSSHHGRERSGSNASPPPSSAVLAANTTSNNISFDLAKFGEEFFDTDAYVRTLLQRLPNEEAVQLMLRTMTDSRENVSGELQRNVYKNYNEFVIISKEISKLEGDMISVRRVLGELKEVRESFKAYGEEVRGSLILGQGDDKAAQALKLEEEMRQKAREDAENENRMNLMKSLYRDVEGLQKALPDLPSRQLLHDGTSIRTWEINPNTYAYKQKDLVFIHVASDALIQTIWKKNLMSGKNRLIIEKWFPISEIGFIDMKDSPEMMNAFKIIKGSDTFMFRTEALQEKRSLLSVITKLTGELVAMKKLEITNAKSPSAVSNPILNYAVSPVKAVGAHLKKHIEDGLTDNDYRWLLELSDELDVLIAQRNFGLAISHIEKARQIMAACTGETPRLNILRSNIDERVTTISRLVSMDLTSPAATKTQIQDDIQRLLRIGLGDQARDIYLTSRSVTIKHRLRQLQFNGDIVSYMIDYSELFFRLIRNTCEWFSVSFHDPSMASGFMKWIQKEIQLFAQVFRKQTFQMQHPFHVISDCVITATERCQDLNTIGLDLTSSFESYIKYDLIGAIEEHTFKCDLEIMESVRADSFAILPPAVEMFESSNVTFDVPIPPMSQSALTFYQVLSMFGSDIGTLMSFTIYNTIVKSLTQFFTTYVEESARAVEKERPVSEYIAILSNCIFIVEKILPTTKSQLKDRFERNIPELAVAEQSLAVSLAAIRTRCLEQIKNRLITVDYPFQKIDYTSSAQILDNIMPTNEMIALVRSLQCISDESNVVLNSKELLTDLIGDIFSAMDSNGANWVTPKGPRKFGFGGVQCFVLDMTFFLRVFEEHVSEDINKLSNELCERALRSYFTQNQGVNVPLKPGDFYDARTEFAIKKLGLNVK